ncbi:hypothetical protein BU26DRAFT_509906 [Trematosphaeria pertusa]|uniref:Uncharacterized protein n=1 Tax=Trematosphaeria pertusa TaxID=390896 RepID=A0A6A6HYU4_9PLEO|nr:uncharacterized protein BU26DRAFT_509906 [Trematosphaeria pertusa]KAF2243385.1 hypothetical protein BU26DRAFT_509906 [Trematosphaeria pertusa]
MTPYRYQTALKTLGSNDSYRNHAADDKRAVVTCGAARASSVRLYKPGPRPPTSTSLIHSTPLQSNLHGLSLTLKAIIALALQDLNSTLFNHERSLRLAPSGLGANQNNGLHLHPQHVPHLTGTLEQRHGYIHRSTSMRASRFLSSPRHFYETSHHALCSMSSSSPMTSTRH